MILFAETQWPLYGSEATEGLSFDEPLEWLSASKVTFVADSPNEAEVTEHVIAPALAM